MNFLDATIIAFGIFSYFAVMYDFKIQEGKVEKAKEIMEKKQRLMDRLSDKRRIEIETKKDEERKNKRQQELMHITEAAERMSEVETAGYNVR